MRLATGCMLAAVLALTGCSRARRPATPPPSVAETALQAAGPAAGVGRPAALRTYTPANMYEAIDGEADLFKAYGGHSLTVGEYRQQEVLASAEVFDQATALGAFGVYTQLAKDSPPAAVGAGGVLVNGDEGVFFWQAGYFVRVTSTSEQRLPAPVLLKLAQAIAAELPKDSSLPPWTAALPAGGKHPQYVARNVLGYGFLSNAMTAECEIGGKPCTLTLLQADEEGARQMAAKLAETTNAKPAPFALPGMGEAFQGVDPGLQPVLALRSGEYLVVIVGECSPAAAAELAGQVLEKATAG